MFDSCIVLYIHVFLLSHKTFSTKCMNIARKCPLVINSIACSLKLRAQTFLVLQLCWGRRIFVSSWETVYFVYVSLLKMIGFGQKQWGEGGVNVKNICNFVKISNFASAPCFHYPFNPIPSIIPAALHNTYNIYLFGTFYKRPATLRSILHIALKESTCTPARSFTVHWLVLPKNCCPV